MWERVPMTTTKHQKSIHVDAPVEKVFDYVKDPAHFYAAMPAGKHDTTVMEDVKVTPDGVGTTYKWTSRYFGIKVISGLMTRQEYVVNERIVDRSSTGPIWTWTFKPDGAGTTLTLAEEHSTRIPLVDKVLDKIAWNADRDLETILAVEKEALEA